MNPFVPGKEVVIKDPNYRPLIATSEEIESVKSMIFSINQTTGTLRTQLQMLESWCMILETRKASLEFGLQGPPADVRQKMATRLVEKAVGALELAVEELDFVEARQGANRQEIDRVLRELRKAVDGAS